jgi:GNAT superfamily N-acetyltransferase
MTQVDPGIPQHRWVVEGCDWNAETERKLRAAALRRTFASTHMLALRDPGLDPVITPVADGYAVFHGPDAMSSFAREVGTSRPVSRKELTTLEEFYEDHGCFVRVWVSDRTHSSLVDMLRAGGYAASSQFINWFRSLDSDPAPCQSRIEVVPVSGALHENWFHTVAAGFLEDQQAVLPATIPASFIDLFFAFGCAFDDDAFLARIDGDFVGGAVLNVTEGIAMLRTASTRFAHRNGGVQQALLAARLKRAREQGAQIAVSQTPLSGPSAHNMAKFGFRPFRSGYMMEKSRAH